MNEITPMQTESQQLQTKNANPEVEKYNAINDCIQSSTDCLYAIERSLNAVDNIVNSAGQAMVAWHEIDRSMHEMDIQFSMFEKQIDSDLEKFREVVPRLLTQIDKLTDQLGHISSTVFNMPAGTEQEYELKVKTMDKMDKFLEAITMISMKML